MSTQSWTQHYRGKTDDQPRPDTRQSRWANTNPRQLQEAQAGWDEAKRIEDKLLSLVTESIAKRAEDEAQLRAKQAKFHQQQREQADTKLLEPAWRSFRASGGTWEEFQAMKSQILAQTRMNAAVDAAMGVAATSTAEMRRTTTKLL